MRLTSRSGQTTVELTDSQWAAMVRRFGARAREEVLTWAGRQRTHAEARARGYEIDDDDQAEIERDAYARAAARHDAEKPCGYQDGLERVVVGARLSPGMALWAAGIVVTDEDRAAAAREHRELWEFSCRELNADVVAYCN
jgi:hypothetical protein